MKAKKARLVYITWVDSTHYKPSSGWWQWSDMKEWAQEPLPEYYTAGFLVYENKNHVCIALSRSKDKRNVGDFIKIPKACIKSIEELRKR